MRNISDESSEPASVLRVDLGVDASYVYKLKPAGCVRKSKMERYQYQYWQKPPRYPPFCAFNVCSSICRSLSISSSFSRSILSFSFSACSRFFFSFSSWALGERMEQIQSGRPKHGNGGVCVVSHNLICGSSSGCYRMIISWNTFGF